MLDSRGQLLRAAVGFTGCSMPSYDRALWALRFWLDSWRGIGDVVHGMAQAQFLPVLDGVPRPRLQRPNSPLRRRTAVLS